MKFDKKLAEGDRDGTMHRDYAMKRRQEGAPWRAIAQETGAYVHYLKGITPPEVGGLAPSWPLDPEGHGVVACDCGDCDRRWVEAGHRFDSVPAGEKVSL